MRRPRATNRIRTGVLTLGIACLASADPATAARPGAEDVDSGRDVYLRHCARCHQRDGRGIDGLYPSLRDLAEGKRSEIIRGLLVGRAGELTMDGVRYDNLMPTHGFLANETLAAAWSHVFTAWSSDLRPAPARSPTWTRCNT